MATSSPLARIPEGSWVLVTGPTGFIASWTVKHLLERGYKVRGTVRSLDKASWLTDKVFADYAAKGALVLVAVPDIKARHALDEAVDDSIAAIIHVAAALLPTDAMEMESQKFIDAAVAADEVVLEAAYAHRDSVKAVVFTANSTSAASFQPGVVQRITRDSWMDEYVTQAADPAVTSSPLGPYIVFFAAKLQAEKAVWQFVEQRKPPFAVNVVTPWTVFGPSLDETRKIASTNSILKNLYDGDKSTLGFVSATYISHVSDSTALHVAAALDPDVKGERIMAWGVACSASEMLEIMRRTCPEKKDFMADPVEKGLRLSVTTDDSVALGLLRKWTGHGWTSLEKTVEETVGAIA